MEYTEGTSNRATKNHGNKNVFIAFIDKFLPVFFRLVEMLQTLSKLLYSFPLYVNCCFSI